MKKYGQRTKRSIGIKQGFRMTVIIMKKQPQIHLKCILFGPLTSNKGDIDVNHQIYWYHGQRNQESWDNHGVSSLNPVMKGGHLLGGFTGFKQKTSQILFKIPFI